MRFNASGDTIIWKLSVLDGLLAGDNSDDARAAFPSSILDRCFDGKVAKLFSFHELEL